MMPASGVQEKVKDIDLHRRAALLAGLCVLGGLAIFLAVTLSSSPASSGPEASPAPVLTQEPTPAADTEPPVISGTRDFTAAVGMTLSYRSGITATDNLDGTVPLQIDASAVDLTQPGEYPVIYRAKDKAGNQTEITVTATVVEASTADDPDEETEYAPQVPEPPLPEITQELVDAEADRILSRITSDSMSAYDKARAIYNYVRTHIKYVGSSDKSSWLVGAYVGFVRGRGDCYNYFACSKALLTRAGISNVDLTRVGGNSRHYWQLVNVGTGWYHFDACPHPNSYPLDSFLLDELQVRDYTETASAARLNYYVYDYASCPVRAVNFPEETLPSTESLPPEGEHPIEAPVETPSEVPEENIQEPAPEAPEPTPEAQEPLPEDQEPEVLLPPEVEETEPFPSIPEPSPEELVALPPDSIGQESPLTDENPG